MNIFDLHCDTIYRCLEGEKEENLIKNNFHISFEKMKKGNYLGQVFACWVDQGETQKDLYGRCNQLLDKFYKDINKSDDIRLALNYADIQKNIADNKLTAMLSIEEGGVIENSLENLKHFYDRGVRMITLTWNFENEIGYPNTDYIHKDKGLKPFGREVVETMNELGIIVDVSHLSDAGFYDVVNHSKKPFIATHSSARALHNHPRNMTDDMIKQLGNHGGVIGANFVYLFLNDHEIAYTDDIVRHMKHIVNKGGIEVCSIGSDFDGCKTPELQDATHMPRLIEVMSKHGFTDDEIELITHKNALRVIKDVL